MKRSYFLALSFALLPVLTYAQGTGLQNFFKNLLTFINTALIPFILGIAFLLFVINVFRYFIFAGATEDGREKAKSLALYSVLAFVVIIVFWGMVNLLASSTGLEGKTAPLPDYLEINGVQPPAAPASPSFGNNPTGSNPLAPPANETPANSPDEPLCPIGSNWNPTEESCQAI